MFPSANSIPHKDDYYKYIDQKYQSNIIKEGTSSEKSDLMRETRGNKRDVGSNTT